MTAANRLSQKSFRGRLDDNVESLQQSDGGATWIAALNTNWTQDVGKIIRPRFLIERAAGTGTLNVIFGLTYSLNAAAYVAVDATSNAIRTMPTSWYVNLSDSTAFTGRLGTGTWADLTNGCRCSVDSAGTVNFTAALTEIEIEFSVFIVKADVAHNDTLDLRVNVFPTTALSNGYTNTPRLTVNEPAGVDEPGFEPAAIIRRAYSFGRVR